MSPECQLRLRSRVECLDDPLWFYEPGRPAGYPEVAPKDYPQLGFSIVGVATAAETEDIYYERLRPQGKYRSAYALDPAPAPDQAELAPKREAIPWVAKAGRPDAEMRTVQVTCKRVDHFLFRYVSAEAHARHELLLHAGASSCGRSIAGTEAVTLLRQAGYSSRY